MNDTLPPEPPGGIAGALGTLRHALADPLSAAGMKLEVLERRLASVSVDGPSLADRVRGAKADLQAAGRLIDLLPRLAEIGGEVPVETSLGELCGRAGIRLEENDASRSKLVLRRRAALDALRSLVGYFGSPDPGVASPGIRAEEAPGRIMIRVETPDRRDAPDLARLFGLPRHGERTEELFLARVGVEADGGRLEVADRGGRPVALLSWPCPQADGAGSGPA